MIYATLVFGGPTWAWPAALLAVASLAVLIWAYLRAPGSIGMRLFAALLKTVGITVLLACLIEPLFSGVRPRPGANVLVILADDSQSLHIRDPSTRGSRAEILNGILAEDASWQTRLNGQFDVRRYSFGDCLRSLDEEPAAPLTAEASRSSMVTALQTIARRFRDQPVAGVLLFTDGNATDLPNDSVDWSALPPVYPVPLGSQEAAPDVAIRELAVTQTNFEQMPVTIRAEIAAADSKDEDLFVELLDASGQQLDHTVIQPAEDGRPNVVRFQLRPEQAGTTFYQVRTAMESEADTQDRPEESSEATLANNSRLVVVEQPQGPYRVLYASGRANWEFKFLRRALAADDQVELVGLIRIAKREPKFSFLSRDGESTNPLYRGFDSEDTEEAEQYDEPVFIRLGTRDETELRSGFPDSADVLYEYDAIILDDVESEFFTQDQMLLVQKFVSVRGGGFLMLGGAESFFQGEFQRTPIGEMMPVYMDRQPPPADDATYSLLLTREGWLQPWVRLRETEEAERERLGGMTTFATLNRVRGIKPGAEVLANVADGDGKVFPALVAQRFGRGRAAALTIGDMWRWSLRRRDGQEDDLAKAWRQTVRWLVADVPGRIGLNTRREEADPGSPIELTVDVRDAEHQPMDNACVNLTVTSPDAREHLLRAEPSQEKAGSYVASYLPRASGAYRVNAQVTAADGSKVGEKQTGWTAEPAADEFRRLTPNRDLLERIAQQSGGEVVEPNGLNRFVSTLPDRKIPIVEPWVYPLWHDPLIFLFAISCLVGEWGLRRWKGLP